MKSIFFIFVLVLSINSGFASSSSVESFSSSEIKVLKNEIINEVREDFFVCFDHCKAAGYEAEKCVKYCLGKADQI